MTNLQERGSFIVEPSSEVYEGQVVGENPRGEDMDVNICREKKQTNTRSATADVYESLTPSRKLTLEESLEFAANDDVRRGHPRGRARAQGRPGRSGTLQDRRSRAPRQPLSRRGTPRRPLQGTAGEAPAYPSPSCGHPREPAHASSRP